ncbi:MAG: hypothetical protein J7L47_10725 [Candidatus Odinarchaeota archaeon]|nr:hypothetical protein [Candidatus Odinarchaeota archaeon]
MTGNNEKQKDEYIQCPCGQVIKSPKDFKLIFIKKEQNEIDILCPNDTCYLREVGFIKFEIIEDKIKPKVGKFYPQFVSWNFTQLGKEKAKKILEDYLKIMVKEIINWDGILEDYKKRKTEKEMAEEENSKNIQSVE